MIRFNDVVDGLATILNNNFSDHAIYTEEIKEGMTRPAFFINFMPQSSNNFNIYYREQAVLIDIAYFSEEKKDMQSNLKNMDMANKLQSVLNTELKILDRSINLQELEYETVDRVLHTTFNLTWYNVNEVTQAHLDQFQLMQQFNITFDEACLSYFVLSNGEIYSSVDEQFFVRCTDEEVAGLRDANFIKI